MKENYSNLLDGMIPKLENEKEIEAFAPDLIVNLETSLPGFTEKWVGKGFHVLGGGKLAHELEADRYGALEFAKEAGILIPQTYPFLEASEATKLLRSTKTRLCCKFNEDGGEKFLSFLGKSNEDVVHFIEKKYKPEKHKGLILQEFIDGPAELNVEGWFSKGELIWPMNGAMEQKRFLSGEMGPNTGCMSTLTWALAPSSLTPWTKEILAKLKELSYSGPLDMAFKVGNDHKFYFLEFTPRAGINAVFGLFDLLDENLGKFLASVEAGTARQMRLRPGFAFILTLSVYPYPYEIPSVYLPGVSVNVPSLPRGMEWWNAGVAKVDGKLVTAEGYPLPGYLSTTDSNAGRAINRTMAMAEAVEVTGKQFRNDGLKLLEPLKLLQSMGIRNA